MEHGEIWSYIISGLSLIWNLIPQTCAEWTTLFALLTVMVTFFFVTLPRAINLHRSIKNKKYSDGDEND